MSLTCRLFGHDGPWWLDAEHQGHCRRCHQPHPEWIRGQAINAAIRQAGEQRRRLLDGCETCGLSTVACAAHRSLNQAPCCTGCLHPDQ